MDKQDYLRDCMAQFRGVPIDAFNREFCTVCSNRECSRSWGNASVFNARVKNWRSVLFENVPRIVAPDQANPNFLPVDAGRVPEIRTSAFETSPAPLSYDDVPDTQPEIATSDQGASVQGEQPTPTAAPTPLGVNTPFQQPVMLPGAPKVEEKAGPAQGNVFVFEDE